MESRSYLVREFDNLNSDASLMAMELPSKMYRPTRNRQKMLFQKSELVQKCVVLVDNLQKVEWGQVDRLQGYNTMVMGPLDDRT